MAKVLVRAMSENTICVSTNTLNHIFVYRPTWAERLIGVTWQSKVAEAVAKLEEQDEIAEKLNQY